VGRPGHSSSCVVMSCGEGSCVALAPTYAMRLLFVSTGIPTVLLNCSAQCSRRRLGQQRDCAWSGRRLLSFFGCKVLNLHPQRLASGGGSLGFARCSDGFGLRRMATSYLAVVCWKFALARRYQSSDAADALVDVAKVLSQLFVEYENYF
jgi:hypothetical protein